jgi:predicted MPP superfamily phosphohydrolase
VNLESVLAELRARLTLQVGTSTLLLAVVPSDAVVEESRRALLELLRATPMDVTDLGAGTSSTGPAQWAELTKARAAGASASVYVLSFVPTTKLEARTFANLLNAERQHMRALAGPLLLVISNDTEQALRKHAQDFYTWAAHGYALPEPRELLALAARLGVSSKTAEPPESPIRFLHVSDFHLRSALVSRYEQDRVLDGLIRFLERDRTEFPLELVFVTGDLAQSGQAEEYEQVVKLLRQLLDVTGVPPARMFVVPGNHDVDRKVGRWLLRTLDGDEQAIAFFEEPDGRDFHRRKLEAYEAKLRELLGPGRSLGLGVGAEAVELVELGDTRLAVASFNSSWFAQDDGDEGKLWLGEPNVRRAIDHIADVDATFTIALMHHPFDHLHEVERDVMEMWFERGFDLVLRGHLHKNKTRAIAGQRGGYVEVAAPAAYQGSQWPNGCFLGEIRPKARTVRLRPYAFASGPDPWVLDPKVFPDDADDGHCRTFSIPAKSRRKSGLSSATRMSVRSAYENATPYQKMHVKRQVLGDEAAVASQHADREVVKRLAEESPELRRQILGEVNRNVALVSAIEGREFRLIEVNDPTSFERVLQRAGQVFLEHTGSLGMSRERMAMHDGIVGLAASLGVVFKGPIAVEPEVMARPRPDIVLGRLDVPSPREIIEVVRSPIKLPIELQRLDAFRHQSPRYAALMVLGSLPEGAREPKIDRVTTPAGRNAWVVHL